MHGLLPAFTEVWTLLVLLLVYILLCRQSRVTKTCDPDGRNDPRLFL